MVRDVNGNGRLDGLGKALLNAAEILKKNKERV